MRDFQDFSKSQMKNHLNARSSLWSNRNNNGSQDKELSPVQKDKNLYMLDDHLTRRNFTNQQALPGISI